MFEQKLSNYNQLISNEIDNFSLPTHPANLYEPISYILKIGGKRLRPLLSLFAADLFSENVAVALPIAKSVEIFHNFSLMHDDIMDKAPLRRNQQTVHTKWNENIAILSGDVMLVKAYQSIDKVKDEYYKQLVNLLNKCAIGVCEGQQLDMDFETKIDVSIEEYIEMIRLKTAVLLGYALEAGALVAGADFETQKTLCLYGELVGIGFQIKDDLLDVFGESQKVGKQVAGDILANKKTYLLLKALEKADPATKKKFDFWLAKNDAPQEKIEEITKLYIQLEVNTDAEILMNEYFAKADKLLLKTNLGPRKLKDLRAFTNLIINRDK